MKVFWIVSLEQPTRYCIFVPRHIRSYVMNQVSYDLSLYVHFVEAFNLSEVLDHKITFKYSDLVTKGLLLCLSCSVVFLAI